MSHVRTLLRTQVKAALDLALPTTEYSVFASRKYAWNHVVGKALVDMRFSNDQTQRREVMSNDRVHIASLYIRVQRSAEQANLDDALDADEVKIVNAIHDHAGWLNLLEEPPELLQVNFSDDSSTGAPVGAIILRFDLEYRIDMTDPETVIA